MKKAAVVLLSGGQDSTTCLYWTLQRFARVHCLSIHYGQRHAIEIEAARKIVEMARQEYPDATITHEEQSLGCVLSSTSPLTNDAFSLGKYEQLDDLPGGVEPTFVPGRNLLFLVIAANRAAAIGAEDIVTGVCQEDFGGYFDCRRAFVDAMEVALSQGMVGTDSGYRVHTPLMDLSKAQSVHLAALMRGCFDALTWSHTCYDGQHPPCGKCHACHLRVRGFDDAGLADPIYQRATP